MQGITWQLVRNPGNRSRVEALVVVVTGKRVDTGGERPRVNRRQKQEDHEGREHCTPGDALHRNQ